MTTVIGVDAEDVCPSPNQSCPDGFEFIDRVGLNRGGDAVLALYILGHLPCPPSLSAELNRVEIVWRVDVGVNLVDPPGSCGSLGRRKLELVTMVVGGPMGVTGRPSQACGIDLRISRRKHRRWRMSSWPNDGSGMAGPRSGRRA